MSKEILTTIAASLAVITLEMQSLSKYLTTNAGKSDFDNEMDKAIAGAGAAPPGVASNEPVDDQGKGIPWTESIHAATKKQTVKGIWKRKNGVTQEEYDRVTAEIKAAGIAGTATPPPPGVNASTTPPPPGAGVVLNAEDKKAAMAAISLLTDEFGLTYESVLATMKAEFSVTSFDELEVDHYPEANIFFTNWANEVRQCDDEIELIVTMAGESGQAGVDTILKQNKVASLETCGYDGLRSLHEGLIKYRGVLDAWVAGQK